MPNNSNYDTKDWILLSANTKYDSALVGQYKNSCDSDGGFLVDASVSKQMMASIGYEFKPTKESVHVQEVIIRHPEGMSQIPMSQKDDLGVKEVLESQYVPKNAKQHIVTTKYIGTIKIDRNAFSFPVNGEIVEYLEEREYSYDFSPEVDTELIKNIIFEIAKTIATSL